MHIKSLLSSIKKGINCYPFLISLFAVYIFLNIFSLIFYLSNYSFFKEILFEDLLIISWFNLITLTLYYLPYSFFVLLPLEGKIKTLANRIGKVVFIATSILLFFLISVGIALYPFSLKHLSFDYLIYICFDHQEMNLFSHFVIEYYWLFLIYILCIASLFFIVKIISYSNNKSPITKRLTTWLSVLLLLFIIGRGGFKLKPIGILDANIYASDNNSALILNSAFTVLKTIHLSGVEEKKYFSRAVEVKLFNPVQKGIPQHIFPKSTNVVIIILESFGNVYVGPNNTESYTPFFDSLLSESMYFEHSISNGSSSMDAIPAILASFPSWTNESFIISSYIGNEINGLPYYLNKQGYHSAFFHGANNGSMRFDAFCKKIGFDSYHGKNEYGNNTHDDGLWGIPDHHFLKYTAKEINKLKSPFLATIFTLSSHHPYKIPDKFSKQVKRGPEKICASLNYTDISLKIFWNSIKNTKWFNNTLFVFCADHTAPTKRKNKLSLKDKYSIPIAFYHPQKKILTKQKEKCLQQMDVMPTVLDLLNYNQKYYAYGSSVYSKDKKTKIAHSQSNFMIFDGSNKVIQWNEKLKNSSNQNAINKLKAAIQRYNRDLIRNKTHVP